MKKTFGILLILVISTNLFSCRTYRIDKKETKRIPYSGNEVLVFQSSKTENDTIFLKGYENFKTDSDYLTLFPNREEHYYLACDCADPYSLNRKFVNQSFVSLFANEDGETIFAVRAILKNTYFYYASFTIEEFDNIPLSRIKIGNKEYPDVKIVETKIKRKHDNYAIRFYWSVSEGFIGLDKENLEWRLTEKYVPQQRI
jgi:hypothetical protein